VVALLAIGAAVVFEIARPRPPQAAPVASRPPVRQDELARMEGGFSWTLTQGGEPVFALEAGSMVGIEGGANFLRDVSRLLVYLEDGRPVELQARRGTVRQLQPRRPVLGEAPPVEIELEGNVAVREPDGNVLRTDRLVYDSVERVARSPGPARLEGEALRARLSSFEYRPDARVLETRGPLELRMGGAGVPWQLDASHAIYRLGTGELVLPEPFRVRQPDRTLVSGPAVIVLPGGEGPPRFDGEGPSLMTSGRADVDWQLAAAGLEALGRNGDDARLEDLLIGSPASLVARRRGGGAGEGSLGAARWHFAPAEGGRWRATIGPAFTARWRTGAADGRWRLRGEALELQQDPAGGLAAATASGQVEVVGPGETRAVGERLAWTARRREELRLEGEAARVRQRGDVVEAPLLVFFTERELLVGEEGAITEVRTLGRREGGLFDADEPVRVRSRRVTLPLDAGPVLFEGPVQAWQLDTTLQAGAMRLLRDEGLLIAEEQVSGRFVLEDEEGPRIVRLAAGRLEYDEGESEAVLLGGASFEQGAFRLNAERILVSLLEDRGIGTVVASGDVRIVQGEDVGTADRLVRDDATGWIELIGEENLARLLPAESEREVSATRIRYHPATGELETQATPGGGGRTVITGTQQERPREEPEPPPNGSR
jgi:lipopolysaccharide export system protein LptA